MYKIMFCLAIGLTVLFAGEPLGAQSTGRVPGTQMGQRPGQGGGRGAGQGVGRGAGQGLGRGAGQGAMMPQRGQGGGQYQGDMLTLLGNPGVQDELKLAPQQLQKLRQLGETEHARQAAQMLSQRGSCERTDERRAVMARVRKDIEQILDEYQWNRLNEIWIQVRGVRALQSERISKTLELTRPQQEQIDQLLSGGFRGRAPQIEQQVLAILTEKQRQQFDALQGDPFQPGGAAGAPVEPPRDGRGQRKNQP